MRSAIKTQRGIALLVLTIIMAMAAITYFLTTMSPAEIRIEQENKTAQVLKQARSALIAYALVNVNKPGSEGKLGKLPCPDYNNNLVEGVEDSNCGKAYANGIGYFPWKEIGIDVLKDNSGTCLLYAVSPAYKTTPAAALTPDSYGQFQIVDKNGIVMQGLEPEDRPVAVIIAAGSPLSGQTRNYDSTTICGKDYENIAAYLDNNGATDNAAIDTETNNIIGKFVQAYVDSEESANPLNDRLIYISYSDIWDPLLAMLSRNTDFNDKMKDLTEALALCLAEYANYPTPPAKRSLPWPAAMNLNGNEYRNSYSYDDNADASGGYSGRLPYQVLNSNSTIGNFLTSPPTPYAGFIEYNFCNTLMVSSGKTIDLTDKAGEYWNLWSNWKEYFFYALSESYSPDNDGIDCSLGCLNIDGADYAGVVAYSGTKRVGKQRYAPPFDAASTGDGDDKDDIDNYLENGREIIISNKLGTGAYTTTPNATTNLSEDIMFCIKTDMSGAISC